MPEQEEKQHLRVVRLAAENVKRLVAVEIEPDGNTVIISGKNGAGKTSILDSIWYALGGGAAMKGTPEPIREGQEEAKVELDLGAFTVTRTWRGDKTSVTVMSKDGGKYGSPQAFLDERLGALSFDPLAFSNLDGKAQVSTLLGLVDLPFDPDDLARQRRTLFERRTDVGREERSLRASLFGLELPGENEEPPAEESTADLVAELAAAGEALREGDRLREQVAASAASVSQLEASLADAQARYARLVEQLHALPDETPDPAEIRGRIETIGERNDAARRRRDQLDSFARLAEVEKATGDLTAEIEAIDLRKSTALAEADLPIEGLAFDDDGMTYQGIPFRQCSAAERLRVSLAMAMALNPTIRVIRITDGSLLDSENMALIEQMAGERDFQCWIERVEDDSAVGFVIEDGELRS